MGRNGNGQGIGQGFDVRPRCDGCPTSQVELADLPSLPPDRPPCVQAVEPREALLPLLSGEQ